MTAKPKPYQIIILVLLVLLPAFFPYCNRVFYLIPYDVKDVTALITLHIYGSFLLPIPYWFMVGSFFARWVNCFIKAFILANLPIFFNVIGEMIYFGFIGVKQATYPWVEYSISSHIDKFNMLPQFHSGALTILSILISAGLFLFVFTAGYQWFEKEFPRKKVSDDSGEGK